jgi:hypothetical protein
MEGAREAVALSQRIGTPAWEARAHLVLARLALGQRDLEATRARLANCEARIRESGYGLLKPPYLETCAQLAECLDDPAARRRDLGEAHRLYAQMGAKAHAERLARELGL